MSSVAKIALHTAQDMLCQLNPSLNRSNSSTNLSWGESVPPSRGHEEPHGTENSVQTMKTAQTVDKQNPGRFMLDARRATLHCGKLSQSPVITCKVKGSADGSRNRAILEYK